MESFIKYMVTTKGAHRALSEVTRRDVAEWLVIARQPTYTLVELQSGVRAPVESLEHASSLYAHLRDIRVADAASIGLPIPRDWGDGMVLGAGEAYLVSLDGRVWRCEDAGQSWTKRAVVQAQRPSAFSPSENAVRGVGPTAPPAVPVARFRRLVVPAYGDDEQEARYREQPSAAHVLITSGVVDTVLAAEQQARRGGEESAGWHPAGRVRSEGAVQFGLMALDDEAAEPDFEANVGCGPAFCEVSWCRQDSGDFAAFVRFVAERRDGGQVETDAISIADFRVSVMNMDRAATFLPASFEAVYAESVSEMADGADRAALIGAP